MNKGRKFKIGFSLFLVFCLAIFSGVYVYWNRGVEIEEDVDNEVMGEVDVVGYPLILNLPPLVAYEGLEYTYLARVHVDEGRDVSLEVVEGPEWLSVSGFVVSGVPPFGSAGSYRFVLRVFDGYNSSVEESYILVIENE